MEEHKMVKATALKPWQKEISKDEYVKQLTAGNTRGVGFSATLNKHYKVDFENPAYQKYRAERVAKKKARIAGIRQRESDRGYKKGLRDGKKQFVESDVFKKKLQAAFNKGAASAKPKANLADRAAKAEAKAKAFQKRADELKAKIQKK
jgi:hypothetical protein